MGISQSKSDIGNSFFFRWSITDVTDHERTLFSFNFIIVAFFCYLINKNENNIIMKIVAHVKKTVYMYCLSIR